MILVIFQGIKKKNKWQMRKGGFEPPTYTV